MDLRKIIDKKMNFWAVAVKCRRQMHFDISRRSEPRMKLGRDNTETEDRGRGDAYWIYTRLRMNRQDWD